MVAQQRPDVTPGRGRFVQTSLLESMIGMLDFQAARYTVAGEIPGQEPAPESVATEPAGPAEVTSP